MESIPDCQKGSEGPSVGPGGVGRHVGELGGVERQSGGTEGVAGPS